jgi:hypothetical protein
MASLLKVRGLDTFKYKTLEYIINPLYLLAVEKDTDRNVLIYIRREIYIINNLRAKILIRNDIIGPEKIVINIVG